MLTIENAVHIFFDFPFFDLGRVGFQRLLSSRDRSRPVSLRTSTASAGRRSRACRPRTTGAPWPRSPSGHRSNADVLELLETRSPVMFYRFRQGLSLSPLLQTWSLQVSSTNFSFFRVFEHYAMISNIISDCSWFSERLHILFLFQNFSLLPLHLKFSREEVDFEKSEISPMIHGISQIKMFAEIYESTCRDFEKSC